MNGMFTMGLLLVVGYSAGWLFNKIGLPKIIGYIATGIIFSPNLIEYTSPQIIETTKPLMQVCLAFIAFEVGGALQWSKIKSHRKEIVSITFLACFLPFILITLGIFGFGLLFPAQLPFSPQELLLLSTILGALASPTEPAATLAVMHQYKAKGKVTDTILGVAALDDVLGILIFSLSMAAVFMFSGDVSGLFGNPALNVLYEIVLALIIGVLLSYAIKLMSPLIPKGAEGQWIVVILSLIILCVGISEAIGADTLLSTMTMGAFVVNTNKRQKTIFRILERYSEELIFLFFFLISGLYLDLSTVSSATILILIFVILRAIGKYVGANLGARLVKAPLSIRKYTAGGLLPQGGIVVGLVLSIYHKEQFANIAELLLTIVMGGMVLHELIGPIAAKYSLSNAGEINTEKQD